MRVEAFLVEPDLVGRRLRHVFELVPENDGERAALPRVVLSRQVGDFSFPAGGGAVAYDSASFPPAGSRVFEPPATEIRRGDGRSLRVVESAFVERDGRRLEVLRRTTTNELDLAGRLLRRRVELVDSGSEGVGLEPNTVYYVELAAAGLPARRTSARTGEIYGLNRALYEALPAVVRRHDTVAGVTLEGNSIQEAQRASGQLRRFVDVFGAALDHLRSRAEGLRDQHDLERVDARYLPQLAAWVGWELSRDKSIAEQRHEIRYAAALHRITGTIPGCRVWVERLTGWQSEVKEFHLNVLRSFDAAAPRQPDERIPTSLDTADARLMANLGRFDDHAFYTYDSGLGQEDWFSFPTVGLFVKPLEGETAEAVARKRDRLLANLGRFLPANVRGVVVVEVAEIERTDGGVLGITEGV